MYMVPERHTQALEIGLLLPRTKTMSKDHLLHRHKVQRWMGRSFLASLSLLLRKDGFSNWKRAARQDSYLGPFLSGGSSGGEDTLWYVGTPE